MSLKCCNEFAVTVPYRRVHGVLVVLQFCYVCVWGILCVSVCSFGQRQSTCSFWCSEAAQNISIKKDTHTHTTGDRKKQRLLWWVEYCPKEKTNSHQPNFIQQSLLVMCLCTSMHLNEYNNYYILYNQLIWNMWNHLSFTILLNRRERVQKVITRKSTKANNYCYSGRKHLHY